MKPQPVAHHSTLLCFFYYCFITQKLSIKLAQNRWGGVSNWDPRIFMHIVMPEAKVWVSDSEALGLRLYV